MKLVDCREFQWLVIRQWNETVLGNITLVYRNQHCRMRLSWASRFEDRQQEAVEYFGALNLIEFQDMS